MSSMINFKQNKKIDYAEMSVKYLMFGYNMGGPVVDVKWTRMIG